MDELFLFKLWIRACTFNVPVFLQQKSIDVYLKLFSHVSNICQSHDFCVLELSLADYCFNCFK